MSSFTDLVPMTKGERGDLARLLRQRARVAKAGIEAREAELLAELEAELAAEFPADDPRWADITEAAAKAVAEAKELIRQRCIESGVRPEFGPGLSLSWYGRGVNADRARRTELRAVGKTRIASLGRAAKLAIDADTIERETALVAGSLTSADAQAFLQAMPTLEALMPPLTVGELEAPT